MVQYRTTQLVEKVTEDKTPCKVPDFFHLVYILWQPLLSLLVGNIQLVEPCRTLPIALPSRPHQMAQKLDLGAHLPKLVAQLTAAHRVGRLLRYGRLGLRNIASQCAESQAHVGVAFISGRGVRVDKIPGCHTLAAVEAGPGAIADRTFGQRTATTAELQRALATELVRQYEDLLYDVPVLKNA